MKAAGSGSVEADLSKATNLRRSDLGPLQRRTWKRVGEPSGGSLSSTRPELISHEAPAGPATRPAAVTVPSFSIDAMAPSMVGAPWRSKTRSVLGVELAAMLMVRVK